MPPGTLDLTATVGSNQANSTGRSAFKVAKAGLSEGSNAFDRLRFVDAVEPAMQLYLADCGPDGPSPWVPVARTFGVFLSFLFLLPLFSFAPMMIPFSAPSDGFLSNWAWHFLAHPILNYVPARAQLELLARAIEPAERPRLRWIMWFAPLVDCIVCLTINAAASIFGVRQVPYMIITSCVPGIIAALIAAKHLVPRDLLTEDVQLFMKFLLVSWVAWAAQFVVLMVWWLIFPFLGEVQQALLSLGVTLMLSGAGYALESIGVWMGVPKYYATELKPMLYFISFLFTAALLSSTKSAWVFLLMLGQDAAKALAILAKIWFFLSAYIAKDTPEVGVRQVPSQTTKWWKRCLSFWSEVRATVAVAHETRGRLRGILAEFQGHTNESLQSATISVGDARLLGHFVRFSVLFAVVEICEVLVPLLYIIVVVLLHVPILGQNREYLHAFKDMKLEDTLFGNSLAFLIEASVLLTVQMVILRVLNFNLWKFAGIVLHMDFWYFTFAFSICCVVWTTVSIAHSGHDLELIRSLLSV